MTAYTTTNKNSTSYTTIQKPSISAVTGSPIGLLLALTYAATSNTIYTTISKNSTPYTTTNKN